MEILQGLWHGSLIQKGKEFRGSLHPSLLHGGNPTTPDFLFLDSFIYLSHHWFGSLLISVKPNHNWFNYLLSFLIEPWLYSDTHHPKAKQIILEKWSYPNDLPFYFTVDDFKDSIWHRFGQWHERRSLPEGSWERCSLLLWRHTEKR